MVCINCGFTSPVFLATCPECNSRLTPAEIDRYFLFKESFSKIEDVLSPAILIDFFRNINAEKVSQLVKNNIFNFIVVYFRYFYSDFFYKTFMRYFQNLQEMLKPKYLYEYKQLIFEELKYLSSKVDFFRKEKNEFSDIFESVNDYDYTDIFYYAKILLKLFSRKKVVYFSCSHDEDLIDFLIFNFLNEIIKKIKSEVWRDQTEDFESILEFKSFLDEFSARNDLYYKKVPKIYLELMSYKNFHAIIDDINIDFLFLPKHDVYVVVKGEYTPNMEEISKMNDKKGGIKLKDLSQEFGISTLESEIIVQILLKRKMGVQTQ